MDSEEFLAQGEYFTGAKDERKFETEGKILIYKNNLILGTMTDNGYYIGNHKAIIGLKQEGNLYLLRFSDPKDLRGIDLHVLKSKNLFGDAGNYVGNRIEHPLTDYIREGIPEIILAFENKDRIPELEILKRIGLERRLFNKEVGMFSEKFLSLIKDTSNKSKLTLIKK